jgi:hypothetical protein
VDRGGLRDTLHVILIGYPPVSWSAERSAALKSRIGFNMSYQPARRTHNGVASLRPNILLQGQHAANDAWKSLNMPAMLGKDDHVTDHVSKTLAQHRSVVRKRPSDRCPRRCATHANDMHFRDYVRICALNFMWQDQMAFGSWGAPSPSDRRHIVIDREVCHSGNRNGVHFHNCPSSSLDCIRNILLSFPEVPDTSF